MIIESSLIQRHDVESKLIQGLFHDVESKLIQDLKLCVPAGKKNFWSCLLKDSQLSNNSALNKSDAIPFFRSSPRRF